MTGAERIAAERKRQIDVEGYGYYHDVDHAADEFATAAACYALPHGACGRERTDRGCPTSWPLSFDSAMWKPGDRLRELEKAGALIAAAIDRLVYERLEEATVAEYHRTRDAAIAEEEASS